MGVKQRDARMRGSQAREFVAEEVMIGVEIEQPALGDLRLVRRFARSRPIESPERILLVQLDHLGDAVLSTPLIAELRATYPAATIDVLASPSNLEVF